MKKVAVDKLLIKANLQSKKGEIKEAKKLYETVLKMFPKNRRAKLGLKALVKTKKKINYLELPNDTKNDLLNLFNQGKLSIITEKAKVLTQKYPKSYFIWNILGVANKGLGRISESLENFTKVTEINPEYADGFNNLGVALKSSGKPEAAVNAYNKALLINPDMASAHNNKGNALKEQGRFDEAIKSYYKAISLKPDYVDALNNLGIAFSDNNKFEDAINSYKKALSLNLNYADAHNNLGVALIKLGKIEEAIEAYNSALKLKPNYPHAYNNLGIAMKKYGNLEASIQAYKKALSLKPDYVEVYNNLGIALKDQGKPNEAISYYRKALSLNPDYAQVYNNIGIILQESDNIEQAIEFYQKALSSEPNYAEAHKNLGIAFQNIGKLDKAIKSYKKALAIKPGLIAAKHMLSALSGEKRNSAPIEYIQELFDRYASDFENALVQKLEYQIPKILSEIILKEYGNNNIGSILDLGCGTGLIGVELRNYCNYIEGIDISNLMLKQAKNKNIYDNLIHTDIIEYLYKKDLNFNCFVATDVFIYVGDLVDVFKLIKLRNKCLGKLIFSTEHTEKDGYHLEKSGRFSHSKSYISNLSNKFGYKISHFSITNLRKEKGEIINGALYILDF